MTAPWSALLLSRFRPDRAAGGAALRNRQNIHALAALGAVDVVSISDIEAPPPPSTTAPLVRHWRPFFLHAEEMRRSAWEVARGRLWHLRPGVHPAVDRYRRASIAKALQRLLVERRYDVVVVEELSLAGYLPVLRQPGTRVVFDAHNVESRLRRELAATAPAPASSLHRLTQEWRTRRLWAEERRAVHQADLVWACSRFDAEELQRLYRPPQPVAVVPNGVDLNAYQDDERVPAAADWSGFPLTLSFLGTYSYRPNEDAALTLIQHVLPRIHAADQAARLLLIGRDPTPAMRRAAAGHGEIVITGAVDSILPFLREPSIVTLPIALGSGTRLKIVEAMASDRPVISTHRGAEGLDLIDGQHLLLREQPAALADAAVHLWLDRAQRAALCGAASRRTREQYSWSATAHAAAQSLGMTGANL